MKRIICIALSLVLLSFALITPVCATRVVSTAPLGNVFYSYEEFEEFVKKANEDSVEEYPVISKEAYLHYDRLFAPKQITVKSDFILFAFESSPEHNTGIYPYAVVSYKENLELFEDDDEYVTLTDFTEADLEKEYKNAKVTKGGYTFGYTIAGNEVESISFIIGDYSVFLHYMYKAADDMAEFRDAGDSADNTIKLIKRFEQLVNGELSDKNATSKTVIYVSSAVAVVVGGAVITFYLKRKKAATAVTDNE